MDDMICSHNYTSFDPNKIPFANTQIGTLLGFITTFACFKIIVYFFDVKCDISSFAQR